MSTKPSTQPATATDEAVDFLVIGAPKAGTTSIFEYLRGHSEITLPPDKEVPYFNDDGVYNSLSWEEYVRRAFPEHDPRLRTGTITPHYMFPVSGAPGGSDYDEYTVPRRIRERLPSVRLIAILRDPVERAYSHHKQEVRLGLESRTFPEAVDQLLRPAELDRYRRTFTRTDCYVTVGEYGRILGAYRDTFPREQMLVLFTETLARQPREVLARIYEFLGVASQRDPGNLGKRYNVSAAEVRLSRFNPASLVRLASANPLARAAWHSLSEGRRTRMLAGYRRINFRFHAWNRRGTEASEPTAEESAALERLREHYAADGARLAELLGEAPPWAGAA